MRLCKNIFIVVFLLSVFAVGTMSFVGTVEAAKWKKYDSFSYNTKNPDPGYKKKVSIVTYIKGTKDIKMNVYGYKTKNNKKMFIGNMYLSKTGDKLKFQVVDSKGKKSKPEYGKTKLSVKSCYKNIKYEMKNG
ncbi:MAG: hypothetical protein FWH54_06300 [Methanobrevibacter sp.]|nr:hypothetical protein [Methanobrevibacter sp.]